MDAGCFSVQTRARHCRISQKVSGDRMRNDIEKMRPTVTDSLVQISMTPLDGILKGRERGLQGVQVKKMGSRHGIFRVMEST